MISWFAHSWARFARNNAKVRVNVDWEIEQTQNLSEKSIWA
jgi:hypothetical protein